MLSSTARCGNDHLKHGTQIIDIEIRLLFISGATVAFSLVISVHGRLDGVKNDKVKHRWKEVLMSDPKTEALLMSSDCVCCRVRGRHEIRDLILLL